ncbi:MAG: type 1 periplasmic binding fold superfamily protein [Myxococcota bacterium]
MKLWKLFLLVPAFALAACGDDDNDVETPEEENEEELITSVTLTLAPMGGGANVVVNASDDDGNGTIDTIEPLTLTAGTTYVMTIGLLNDLETPAEDIGAEVADEDDEHQFFFLGMNVESESTGTVAGAIATVSYGDMDDNGDPVGLVDTSVVANVAGTGDLRVILRHLPDLKESGLAGDVATNGLSGLPGDSDIDVTFPLTVN